MGKRIPLDVRFWRFVDKRGPDDCWAWTGGTGRGGYGRIGVQGRHVKAPRVAYSLLVGPVPSDAYVCHRCDNPPCVNPAHLFLGSPTDNHLDMRAKGRAVYQVRPDWHARGERCADAKLTSARVREIKIRSARHVPYSRGPDSPAALAREFGVSSRTISQIVAGQKWRHIVIEATASEAALVKGDR